MKGFQKPQRGPFCRGTSSGHSGAAAQSRAAPGEAGRAPAQGSVQVPTPRQPWVRVQNLGLHRGQTRNLGASPRPAGWKWRN